MNPSEAKQKQTLGKLGELLAAKYLQERGFTIIERNYHAGHGEIDLIARDGDTLVFVEVKTRKSTQFGLPEEAITPKKLREIIHTAHVYTTQHKLAYAPQRVDAVAILMHEDNTSTIRYLENVS